MAWLQLQEFKEHSPAAIIGAYPKYGIQEAVRRAEHGLLQSNTRVINGIGLYFQFW